MRLDWIEWLGVMNGRAAENDIIWVARGMV